MAICGKVNEQKWIFKDSGKDFFFVEHKEKQCAWFVMN